MSSEAFAHDVLKIAVAHHLHTQHEFTHIDSSALEVSVDLLKMYFEQVGSQSRYNAEIAGRTECNYHDIMWSLQRILDIKKQDLIDYSDSMNERPWPRESISQFAAAPSIPGTIREEPADNPSYIPSFLPEFPPDHSYKRTGVYSFRDMNPAYVKQQKSQQIKEAEHNQSNLHTREVGSRNIINYEQTYDQKISKSAPIPFQLAKDAVEMAQENEIEVAPQAVAPTPVDRSRLMELTQSNNE